MDSKPSPTLYWGPVILMGSTQKHLLWIWHELLSHRWVIFRHLFWKKLTEVTAHQYTSIYLECLQRQTWNMGRWPPNSKRCSPWCCSGHGLLPSPLGVWFHESKILRAFRTSKNGVSCTSTGFLCRPVVEKKMVKATIPLWQKTPSTHDTTQLWQPPTAVRAMMRNESIKTKSFSYSLKKLQQRTRITLPCDESFVPNRSKLFNWISFFRARFGLRPFRFHHRNSQICGLVWTRVDSLWARVHTPKSLSYDKMIPKHLSCCGLGWVESTPNSPSIFSDLWTHAV